MYMKRATTRTILISLFSGRVGVPVFFSLLTSILLPATVWYILTSQNIFDIIGGIIAFIVILFIWLTMVWGELRLRAIRISFTDSGIELQPFLGFGNKKFYKYDHITGFQTTLQPALPLPNECITLISNKQTVVHISRYYYSNYTALKTLVKQKFDDDGIVQFNLKKMFIEIFS